MLFRSSSMETDYKNEKINVASLNLSRLAGVFCAKIKVENYISKYNIDLIHSFGYRADRISQKLTLPVLSSIRNYPHDEYISRYNLIFGYFLSISHMNTTAPLSRHTFAVAHPIPDAPAEIIIFLFFND